MTLGWPKQDAGPPYLKCNVVEDEKAGHFPGTCGPSVIVALHIKQSVDLKLYLENYDLVLKRR